MSAINPQGRRPKRLKLKNDCIVGDPRQSYLRAKTERPGQRTPHVDQHRGRRADAESTLGVRFASRLVVPENRMLDPTKKQNTGWALSPPRWLSAEAPWQRGEAHGRT